MGLFCDKHFDCNPAYFIGLIVFIGYILLKKPIYDAFAGFIKATVGT